MTAKFSMFSFSSLAAVAVAVTLTATPEPAAACGTDAYLGQICIIAGAFCPQNTAEANGQILPITANQALFSLLGWTYGGDGRTNFALPDLRGRAPVGYGQGPGLTPHAVGQRFGSESVTMTVSQMPMHTHTATFTPAGGGDLSASLSVSTATPNQASATTDSYLVSKPAFTGGINGSIYTSNDTTLTAINGVSVTGAAVAGTVTVDSTGGGQPIPVVNPQIAIRYCIVTNGIYPSRP